MKTYLSIYLSVCLSVYKVNAAAVVVIIIIIIIIAELRFVINVKF
jgi:hypothetical protein